MPKVFNFATNKQGLIVFGGEASSDFGMVVSEAPSFERSQRKSTTFTVPGRNGAVLFQQDAWEDVPRSYKVWIANENGQPLVDRVNAFEAWLNSVKGYQRLEDNFEPDVYRLAYFNGGASVSDELTMYGETTISFTCRAERFYKSGEQPIAVVNGDTIVNPTRFASKPLIHIEVSSPQTITISIGGKTITAEVDDFINIDCERMNAYRLEGEGMNTEISGTFPTIEPGNNGIVITGTATAITIIPRYFTV